MKPARFIYERPSTLPAALQLLSSHESDAAILGGGQSLVPMLNLRVAAPRVVIDVNGIEGLEQIHLKGDCLTIGARARHNDVLRSPLVLLHAPLLPQALKHVAHEAIRNRGTLGGSLALADPAAELPGCMACLGARIVAASVDGERSIPAGDFFEGIYATALKPHEMIVRIEVPVNSPGWTYHFDEIARRHGDFAVGGLALGVRHDSHTMAECRVAYVGMEAFSRRLPSVEQALANVAFNDAAAIESAVRLLDSEFEFVEGGEFPSSYRLRIAQHLLTRSLKHIAEVARTDGNR